MVIPNISSVMLGNPSFLNFHICITSGTIFFRPDLRRLPSQQTPNIWYALVANMLESNPVVRNISEIHFRLHKLRCIPILTLHFQHGSHSPPPAASLQPGPARPYPTLQSRKTRLLWLAADESGPDRPVFRSTFDPLATCLWGTGENGSGTLGFRLWWKSWVSLVGLSHRAHKKITTSIIF